MKMDDAGILLAVAGVVLGLIVMGFFVTGAILYAGWNYGVAAMFDAPALGYWPACFIGLGLRVFQRILTVTVNHQ